MVLVLVSVLFLVVAVVLVVMLLVLLVMLLLLVVVVDGIAAKVKVMVRRRYLVREDVVLLREARELVECDLIHIS